ncbi:MAG: hypothetical protein BGN96_13705 [Bacteroidales bacterium 45-6]|nr:MAG: hypothetical protein BGN96_13705 [Bacteroidales bacterium 45-6]
MLQKIENWLKNPKRDYASGLEFFNRLADTETKARFGGFLNGVKDVSDSKETVVHFPQLIQRVSLIHGKIKANPDAYKDLLVTESTKESVEKLMALQKKVDELDEKIGDLQADADGNADEIDSLGNDLDESNEKIEELKKKLAEKNVTVITPADLPKQLAAAYARNKEITPLMASLHASLKDESISDEQRQGIAKKLCDLDDERRGNWDGIDNYLESGNLALPEDRMLIYSEDPVIKGAQIAKRIDRLRENIKKSGDALTKHRKAGKENLVVKAQNRLDTYTEELNGLQKELDEKG